LDISFYGFVKPDPASQVCTNFWICMQWSGTLRRILKKPYSVPFGLTEHGRFGQFTQWLKRANMLEINNGILV
jgi:hypothetical protein